MTKEERIAELEAKNADLEKENVELQKEADFFHREKGEYKSAFLQEVRKTIKLNKQLTKAKEIINAFLDFEASAMERGCYIADDMRRRAEQFLGEVEK